MELDKILWGITTIFVIVLGLIYTKNLDFVQFKFKQIIKSLEPSKRNKKAISPFESLTMSLAARIGVGSLAGVALAIYKGGPGAIFWLLLIVFISAPTSFAETLLAIIYREKDSEHIYRGGPAYYIKKGLNKKKLANLYAVLIFFSYIFGFLTIQANTITKSITEVFRVDNYIIGILIAVITFLIIFNGVKSIARVTAKLVPIMSIIYLTASIVIVVININKLPNIINVILDSAFNIKAFGWGIISTLIIGVQRSIFSNEAGLGTGSIAASTSNVRSPVKGAYIQMLGVYFTTLVVCGLTSLVILTSNYDLLFLEDVNGIEITNYAMNYHLGSWGSNILIISIILFAFSTIITGYYYGESNLKFLFKHIKKKHLKLLKIFTCVLLLFGSISSSNFLWSIVDTLVALLALTNLYALYKLKEDVIKEWTYYKLTRYNK